MIRFKDDYSEGCHPNILAALSASNKEQQEGYGEDTYSIEAKKHIKKHIACENATIHFVSGGTQANLIVISSLLKPYEAVISAHSGHINIHEAGAIEATGHKVCTSYSENGKLTVEQIEEVVEMHQDPPHMVKPRLVYISNATEVGTVYSAEELKRLYEYCQIHNLLLFVDGARLGVALTAKDNNLSLADMAKYTDAFYIGGTKNGALLGEAIVISNETLQMDFAYNLKQKGALMAKGRLLGIQFLELFKENLFFELATHANTMATELATIIQNAGFKFLQKSTTNQLFPIFPNSWIPRLQEKFQFYTWQVIDNKHTAIRLVCSWATPKEAIEDFAAFIDSYENRS